MGKRDTLKIFVLLAFAILIFPNISAVDTTIKIKTVPFANLNIIILDPQSDGLTALERINKDANNYGDVSFTFSSSVSSFDMSVFIKKNDEKVGYEKFINLKAGETLSFEIAPEGTELFYAPDESAPALKETNETINITNETQTSPATPLTTQAATNENNPIDKSPGITGLATTEDKVDKGIFSNKLIYFILGFLVLGAIIFTGALKMRGFQDIDDEAPVKSVNVKKLSEKLKEMKDDRPSPSEDYKKAIEDAEQKIKDAQKEISKLKNADRIKELRRKIDQEKSELDKLENSD